MKCLTCGFIYQEGLAADRQLHKKHCQKFVKAQQRHGFRLVNDQEGENIKLRYNPVVDDETKGIETRIEAAIKILWVYYSAFTRDNGYRIGFRSFIKDLLHQEQTIFPDKVMEKLILDYHPRPFKRRKPL